MMHQIPSTGFPHRGIRDITLLVSISVIGQLVALQDTLCAADSVTEILAAWKQRQQQWNGVRFHFSGTRTTASGYSKSHQYSDINAPIVPVPPVTRTCECPGVLVLDYERGRVRIEETGETFTFVRDALPFPVPRHEILVFDGERYQAYKPKEGNTSPETNRRNMRYTQIYNSTELVRPGFPYPHRPLLLACGELVAAESTMLSDIGETFPAEEFHLEDNVEHQGVPCTVLRTTPDEKGRYREYWVKTDDPRQIVRYDKYGVDGKGGLWLSITIDYQLIDGEPIPHTWEVTQYSFQTGEPRTFVCRLESFEANPQLDDSEFVIEEKPGMIVHDSTRPKEDRRYVANVAGQPEIPYLEFVRKEQAAQEQARNWWLYGLVAAGLALLLAGWLRHRQRTA